MTRHRIAATIVVAMLAGSAVPSAADEPTSEDLNKSNNPLSPALGINLQDQYVASYYGLRDADSNAGLLRTTVPHRLGGWPQIVRATIPIVTSPDGPLDRTSGLGDINVLDVVLFRSGPLMLGVGPQLTVPSATDDRLGTGRWQAGAAVTGVLPQAWGLVGALATYQHSFGGDTQHRGTQNSLQFQPFLIYNLQSGFYLRSTASWSFDLEHGGGYTIPLGFGAGHVWKLEGGTALNLFAEPQYTIAHDGVGPQWQIFMGLNFQFPLGPIATKGDQRETL